jgi:hypothetical protein
VTVDRELELTRLPVVADRRMLFHAPAYYDQAT